MAGHPQPSLFALHEQLRTLEQAGNHTDSGRIRAEIQNKIPEVSTGGALPCKKTAGGQIQILRMNYVRSQDANKREVELEHLRFFARTAHTLGLSLDIMTSGFDRRDVEAELTHSDYDGLDYRVTESPTPLTKWAEDSVEFLENGLAAVPPSFDAALLEQAMNAGRRHRWKEILPSATLEEALHDDDVWIPLGIRVNAGHALEHQTHEHQEVVHLRAYIEGGNMITGEDASGQPVVLVGKDAIATTAYLYQVDEDDVKTLICEDFGLAHQHQVIGVEQPGQFHLDMGLLFLGQGIVVVNDSHTALSDALEMAKLVSCLTTQQQAAKRQLQHALEEAAAQDLEQAGLTVIRQKLADDTAYNFFNGEFIEGHDGMTYYLTNGGPPEQEAHLHTLMVNEWGVANDVIFSPKASAQKSLQQRGGVGCRLKGRTRISAMQ